MRFAVLLLLVAPLCFADDAIENAVFKGDDLAIATLRDRGQPAVDAMMRWRESKKLDAAASQKFDAAIDRVCRQRDCAWSGLYWYTNLDEATRVARRENKRILSLRLLGNLDDELSCANSRFFRTILYSNREVAAYLRANFVLHWQSVRPVPKITIDFGDGRVMTGTLTGNSIHYVLASDGSVIDAIPGLYSPAAFLTALQGGTPKAVMPAKSAALTAAALTASKAVVETPALNRITILDEQSLQLIRTKSRAKDFDAMIVRLAQTIAADTQRNDDELRPVIRRWIASGMSLDALNRRVYAELFLTPDSDPWLGLYAADVYNGIEAGGITATATDRADTTSDSPSRAPGLSGRSRR